MGNAVYRKTIDNFKRIRNLRYKGNNFIRSRKAIVFSGISDLLILNGDTFHNLPPSTLWINEGLDSINFIPHGFAYNSTSGSDGHGGIVFDGNGDYFDTGDNSYFNFTDSFYLRAVFKYTAYKGLQTIIGNFEEAGYGISTRWDTGNDKLIIGTAWINGEYRVIPSDFEFELNTIYDVILTYDGLNFQMTINGVLQSTKYQITGGVKASTQDMTIGINPGGTSQSDKESFCGTIYSIELTDFSTMLNNRRINL